MKLKQARLCIICLEIFAEKNGEAKCPVCGAFSIKLSNYLREFERK